MLSNLGDKTKGQLKLASGSARSSATPAWRRTHSNVQPVSVLEGAKYGPLVSPSWSRVCNRYCRLGVHRSLTDVTCTSMRVNMQKQNSQEYRSCPR